MNIASSGNPPIETIKAEIAAAANLCEPHGWHVQMFVNAAAHRAAGAAVARAAGRHRVRSFRPDRAGHGERRLRALQGLLETGKTWVKISGAYRISDDPNDPRIDPLARALCEANPERIVWGSDWPHTPRHDMREAAATRKRRSRISTRAACSICCRAGCKTTRWSSACW